MAAGLGSAVRRADWRSGLGDDPVGHGGVVRGVDMAEVHDGKDR